MIKTRMKNSILLNCQILSHSLDIIFSINWLIDRFVGGLIALLIVHVKLFDCCSDKLIDWLFSERLIRQVIWCFFAFAESSQGPIRHEPTPTWFIRLRGAGNGSAGSVELCGGGGQAIAEASGRRGARQWQSPTSGQKNLFGQEFRWLQQGRRSHGSYAREWGAENAVGRRGARYLVPEAAFEWHGACEWCFDLGAEASEDVIPGAPRFFDTLWHVFSCWLKFIF